MKVHKLSRVIIGVNVKTVLWGPAMLQAGDHCEQPATVARAGRMLSADMYRNAGLSGLMRSSIAAPLVSSSS